MATAPVPRSQLARYCMPTLTALRSPASVRWPGVSPTASSWAAVTATSSRARSSWFGRSPSTPSKTSRQIGTRSGWPPRSRRSRRRPRGSCRRAPWRGPLDLGVAPAGDERRHAADRVRATLVAGPHEQFGVRPQERHGHGDGVAVGQQEVRPAGAEPLDDAEHVVPPPGVQPGGEARAARRGSPPSRTRPGTSRSARSPESCPGAGRAVPERARTRRSTASPRGGSPFGQVERGPEPRSSCRRPQWNRYRPKSTRLPDIRSPSMRMCFSVRCQPRGRKTIVAGSPSRSSYVLPSGEVKRSARSIASRRFSWPETTFSQSGVLAASRGRPTTPSRLSPAH